MGITDDGQRYWPRHMRGRPRHMASGRTDAAPEPAATVSPAAPPTAVEPAVVVTPGPGATPTPALRPTVVAGAAPEPQATGQPAAAPEATREVAVLVGPTANATPPPALCPPVVAATAFPSAEAVPSPTAPAREAAAPRRGVLVVRRPGAGPAGEPAAEVVTPVEVVTAVGSARRRRLRAVAAIAGAAASGLAACQPVPASPAQPGQPGQPAPSAATRVAPSPSRVAVAGDSLVVLAALNGGDTSWADTHEKVGLGWQAEHVQPQLDRDVRQYGTSPEVLVVALGHNDAAGTGGLTAEDRAQLHTLMSTPHELACVVLVKPHYAGTDPARLQGIEAYRAWVDEAAPTRADTVVVDWRPEAVAHPEYVAPDGFHLESAVPAGNRAYTDLLRDGARTCD